MLPIWVYLLVAAAIAIFASGIGQLSPGTGTIFVALASTMWVAYSVRRKHRLRGTR